jgi:hypothetical protein
MMMDDPETPEFANWNSFHNFAQRVRHERRYATDAASRAFIATVMATAPQREFLLNKEVVLVRAQIGVTEKEIKDNDGDIVALERWGYRAERMKPIVGEAREGRANPAGVAFLYLASDIETAVSEVRPWIRARVSVAYFRAQRDLRLVGLTIGREGQSGAIYLLSGQSGGDKVVDAETKRRAVWTDIDSAFSRPVTRDENTVDYVPTQILAEAFREHGYDGLVYRSNFGDPGYNVVLFDLEAAKAISCAPYEVKTIKVSFEQAGQDWYAAEHDQPKG